MLPGNVRGRDGFPKVLDDTGVLPAGHTMAAQPCGLAVKVRALEGYVKPLRDAEAILTELGVGRDGNTPEPVKPALSGGRLLHHESG